MHEGYARPPCGVTLTGFRSRARSTRAFYPRRTELEGVSCAPGAVAGVILPQPSHGGAPAA